MIRIPYCLPDSLTFKIAETRDELEQAFRLLHDAYVKSGFMKPHPSGLRVTPYHALPTTTTLIVLQEKTVVGTVSIIRDSYFGIPSDQIFDLGSLRSQYRNLAEISALALHPSFRWERGGLFLPLTRYLYEYCQEYFNVDCMVASVNPSMVDFYKAIIGFRSLSRKRVETYDFVNGAPAEGIFMDVKYATTWTLEHYLNHPPDQNLWAYAFQTPSPRNFKFPDRTLMRINDPVLRPEDLTYFFETKTDVLKDLTPQAAATLRYLYRPYPEYMKALPKRRGDISLLLRKRRDLRFDVNCSCIVRIPEARIAYSARVTNVSAKGFTLLSDHPLASQTRVEVQIKTDPFSTVRITGRLAWSGRNQMHGFEVLQPTLEWNEYIEYLRQDIDKSNAA